MAEFLRQRERYTEEEIKEFFERADVDGGGSISKEEFVQVRPIPQTPQPSPRIPQP